MKNIILESFDGYKLSCNFWDEVENPKGVIQFIHGMTSHMARYDDFGKAMNKAGYIVFGDDHRPHGKTAGLSNLGRASKNNFFENVKDEIYITKMLKAKYSLPVQLFAHSYGSFLAKSYIEGNSELVEGVVLSGSSIMSRIKLLFGIFLTSLQQLKYRMDTPNPFLFNMIFTSNQKYFPEEETPNSWLNSDVAKVQEYNEDPYCNFLPSHGFYYSMMRGLYKTYNNASFEKIRKDLPIYIISGSKDPLGGMGEKIKKLYEKYIEHGLSPKMELVEGARHELSSGTEREIFFSNLIDFYNSNLNEK